MQSLIWLMMLLRLQKQFNVADASGLTAKTYVDLNGENIYIKSDNGTKLNVLERSRWNYHYRSLKGEEIFVINAADNALIEEGDDFGFSGGF